MSHRTYITLDQSDALERDLFEAALLTAAHSPTPSHICDIHHDEALLPKCAKKAGNVRRKMLKCAARLGTHKTSTRLVKASPPIRLAELPKAR